MSNINKSFNCGKCNTNVTLTSEGDSFICPNCQTRNNIGKKRSLIATIIVSFLSSFILSWIGWAIIWKLIKTVEEPSVKTMFGASTDNGLLTYKNAINIGERSLTYAFFTAIIITVIKVIKYNKSK